MRFFSVLLSALFLCAACSTGTGDSKAPSQSDSTNGTSTSQSSEQSVDSNQTAEHPNATTMQMTVEQYGLSPEMIEGIQVVRNIKPEEWNQVNLECLEAQGFYPIKDGSYSIPEEQKQAWGLAQYSCLAQFPVDSAYAGPYGESEHRRFYEYWGETTIPCLVENGYPVNELPSFEVFQANVGTPNELYPLALDSLSERGLEAEATCRTIPSSDYIRGFSDTP